MNRTIVVGSGISGLRFSLFLAEHRSVLLLTKKEAVESNTNYAQGGVAVVLGEDDSLDLHIQDTMKTGGGIADPEAVRTVVTEGPARVKELIELGAQFEFDSNGKLVMGREGGHCRKRVVHCADKTGREIERILLNAVEKHPNITVMQYHFAVDLIMREGRVAGVLVLDPEGKLIRMSANLVCLSTGGLGRVFRYTTNPEIATGDGVAIGYRAGAVVRDMEFIQFHPTALARPGASSFLISEAVRGEGGYLTTISGERFMKKYDPEMLDLAPRDVVARAISIELKRTGDPHVLLNVSQLGSEFLRRRFPTIYSTCLLHGVEIDKEPIPVVPAAHYSCGGLKTDLFARTTVPGLYSIGETASHGLHGANRLASNSLLEALVFAYRGAQSAREEPDIKVFEDEVIGDINSKPPCGMTDLYSERLNLIMSQNVGVFRNIDVLQKTAFELTAIRNGIQRLVDAFSSRRELLELSNIALCAELIVRSALKRKESRGLHFLEGYPQVGLEFPGTNTELINKVPRPMIWK